MNDVTYISSEGLQKLKEELEYRKTTLRREIAEAIRIAKEQGDLSENFEYQDAKDRQGDNEVKIGQLEQKIGNSVVVDTKTGESAISLGSRFVVELENGERTTFEMCGSSEADPLGGKISNESPLGNAFLGKSQDETAEVDTPSGKKIYKIISIE